MPPARDDPRVLSYGDVLLRRSDADTLHGRHWLNDQARRRARACGRRAPRTSLHGAVAHARPRLCGACARAWNAAAAAAPGLGQGQHALATLGEAPNPVHQMFPPFPPQTARPSQVISFWFEYLARGPFAGLAPTVALVPPSCSFLLVHAEPSVSAQLLAPLGLAAKALVLLPVSDNPDADVACGGSHWSLLAFHAASNKFLHFDSSPGGSNGAPARELAGALSHLVRRRRSGGGGAEGQPAFEACPHAPRQANGHDCGVYVLAVTRQLCAWQAEGSGALLSRLPELPALVTPAMVAALRREVLTIIRRLAAQERGEGPREGEEAAPAAAAAAAAAAAGRQQRRDG
jgi:sentrin-specific protease 8